MESRGQGFQSNYFYIYELRTKTLPLPWRRGTRRSLWKRATAELDELELEPWVSLWSYHFGEESTPPLAWRTEKFTAVEDFAPYSVEAVVQDAAAAGKERGTRAAAAGKEGNKE